MDQLGNPTRNGSSIFVRDCYVIRDSEPLTDFPGRLVKALYALSPLSTPPTMRCALRHLNPTILKAQRRICPQCEQTIGQHMNEHASLVYYMQTGDGHATRISDFLSRRQFHDTGLYSDFYRDYHIEDDLCFGIFVRPTLSIGIVWHGDRRFTERERCMANLIRPHVVQAWQNARLLSEVHSQRQLLEDGLKGAALVLLPAIRKAACDLSLRWRGSIWRIFRRLKGPRSPTSAGASSLGALPERATQREGCAAGTIAACRAEGGESVDCKDPIKRRSQSASSGGDDFGAECAALAEFCLSRRESEVLAWVAQGKTNGEIAAILSVSPQTARSTWSTFSTS